MAKSYEKAVAELLKELDDEHAEYQRLHRRFYMEDDENAKLIYRQRADEIKRLLKRIEFHERR
jgi:hypothetical protein